MTRIFVCVFITYFSFHLTAQKNDSVKKPTRFSFEYSIGYQRQNMTELNRYYIDSFAAKMGIFTKHIHPGTYRNLSFIYRPSRFWSVGMNYKTDQAHIENESEIFSIDQSGNVIDTLPVFNKLSSKNSGLGVLFQFHWNTLLSHCNHSTLWENLQISSTVGLSYHLSVLTIQSKIPMWNVTDRDHLHSDLWGASLQLKASYPIARFGNSKLRAGFNLGYQWTKSDSIQFSTGDPWLVGGTYPIKANYSGMNCGVSLTYEIGDRDMHPGKKGSAANALFIDIFGQALYGTLGYDRILNHKSTGMNHSISAGVLFLNQFPWTYLRVFAIPLSYNLLIDFQRNKNLPHKLELGIGVSGLNLKSGENNYSITESFIYPSLRVGYRYHSMENGLFFRATFTPVLPGFTFAADYSTFGEAAIFGQKIMPWAGISIGKTF